MDIARQIGNNIKHYRTRKNLSIQELADAVCKSRATMYKYENGQIIMDINVLYDLAEVLEVPVDHLLYQPPMTRDDPGLQAVPAFFVDLNRLYAYYYDGRRKKSVKASSTWWEQPQRKSGQCCRDWKNRKRAALPEKSILTSGCIWISWTRRTSKSVNIPIPAGSPIMVP